VSSPNNPQLSSPLQKKKNSLAKHFLWLARDLSVSAMETTYLVELVTDMSPHWDQRDKKHHNRDITPNPWNQIGHKLNVTGKH
jgi:hypothetical protein